MFVVFLLVAKKIFSFCKFIEKGKILKKHLANCLKFMVQLSTPFETKAKFPTDFIRSSIKL